jgi:hypothetical protein
MRLLGIILAVCGALLIIYGGVTLFIEGGTQDLGPLSVTLHENLVIPLTPVLGLLCLGIGILLILSAPSYAPPPPGA